MSLVQRGGRVRSTHMSAVTGETLKPMLHSPIECPVMAQHSHFGVQREAPCVPVISGGALLAAELSSVAPGDRQVA